MLFLHTLPRQGTCCRVPGRFFIPKTCGTTFDKKHPPRSTHTFGSSNRWFSDSVVATKQAGIHGPEAKFGCCNTHLSGKFVVATAALPKCFTDPKHLIIHACSKKPLCRLCLVNRKQTDGNRSVNVHSTRFALIFSCFCALFRVV